VVKEQQTDYVIDWFQLEQLLIFATWIIDCRHDAVQLLRNHVQFCFHLLNIINKHHRFYFATSWSIIIPCYYRHNNDGIYIITF